MYGYVFAVHVCVAMCVLGLCVCECIFVFVVCGYVCVRIVCMYVRIVVCLHCVFVWLYVLGLCGSVNVLWCVFVWLCRCLVCVL